jgi:hypothetical protein
MSTTPVVLQWLAKLMHLVALVQMIADSIE